MGRALGCRGDERRWDFVALNSEDQQITYVAGMVKRLRGGMPVDYSTGFDLSSSLHLDALWNQLGQHEPCWVVFSLRSWASTQASRRDRPTRELLQAKEFRAQPFLLAVAADQERRGRGFLGICPLGAHHNETEEINGPHALCAGGEASLVHACANGQKDAVTGLPQRRPLLLFSPAPMERTEQTSPGPSVHAAHATPSAQQPLAERFWHAFGRRHEGVEKGLEPGLFSAAAGPA